MPVFPGDFRTYLQLTLVACLWGGTFVAGRFLGPELPAMAAAALRFLLASLTLLVFLLLVHRQPWPRLNWRQTAQVCALGLVGIFAYNLCFFYGLSQVSASRASLIVALNPAGIALLAWLLYREHLSPLKLSGIAACIVGAMLVIISRDPNALGSTWGVGQGELLILGCVASWTIYTVCARPMTASIGPLFTVSFSIFAGSAMLLACAWWQGELTISVLSQISAAQWLSLAYLGVLGSALAYIWYYAAIARIGAMRSGAFIALNPLSAVLLSVLLLGEQINLLIAIGGAIAIVGIYLCNRPAGFRWPRRRKALIHPAAAPE